METARKKETLDDFVQKTIVFSLFFKFFKSTNILLSDDYEAKISDFGMAKLMPEGQETNVTQGYFDPVAVFFGWSLWQFCIPFATVLLSCSGLLFISAGSVPWVFMHQVVVVAVFPPRMLSAKVLRMLVRLPCSGVRFIPCYCSVLGLLF
ncbi:hypothetical protein LXL04_005215 [Taraxacum kok-saghyz]